MDEAKSVKQIRVPSLSSEDGTVSSVTFSVGDVVTYKPKRFRIVSVKSGVILGLNYDPWNNEVVQLDWREIEHAEKVNTAVFPNAQNEVEIKEE